MIRDRKPMTLLALYEAAKLQWPALADSSRNPQRSGLSQLDEIFLMHRAFYDENGNWKYDHNG